MVTSKVLTASAVLLPVAFAASNGTASITFASPLGYETKVYNAAAASATITYNYTNEELAMLWNQVGKIALGPITTTVSPTPEPSAYPRPGSFHPQIPTYDTSLNEKKLPDDFIWGVASSAYQVEGAANAEGKGPSIWDMLAHRDYGVVADNTTGDVVASQYWLYKQDIARLANLGVPYYSPSFSWPRFFPFGSGPVNEAGVKHYDDLISTMVEAGIKPVVTLFHWDTPLALFNSYGAWTDSKIIADYVSYAKYVITRYDEYVPIWYTFNEPQYCNWQYSTYPAGNAKGLYPAYNNITGGLPARIACSHNTILAHAEVAKWYHGEFKGKGRISFKNSGNYYEPRNASLPSDVDATTRQFEFALGWFAGCWRDGDYSSMLKATLGSLLPVLTQEQKDLIKGSCDFYAIDPYTGFLATTITGGSAACAANSSAPGYPECAGSSSTGADGFPLGPAGDNGVNWLWSTPTAIRRFLNTLTKDLFPAVQDVVVSEFGFAEPFEGDQTDIHTILWDSRRADYYQSYLDNILAAKVVDGVNVTGAFGWAIFDNFEWFSGSRVRFGMQYLDQKTLQRYPKASLFQFLDWFKAHGGAMLGAGSAGGNRSAIPDLMAK